jgi:hypothetical protein
MASSTKMGEAFLFHADLPGGRQGRKGAVFVMVCHKGTKAQSFLALDTWRKILACFAVNCF